MKIMKQNETPNANEYCYLRKICGLSEMSERAAKRALPNTIHGVTLRLNQRLIGMGRIVGDGGCHMQVVDIAVHPDFQKQGLSREILDELRSFIDDSVPDCAVVSLFADVDYLYQKYDFGYPKKSKGMFYFGNR